MTADQHRRVRRSSADALPVYLAIVVGLALVLLMLVFRSMLVPVKAALGFLLSIGAPRSARWWRCSSGAGWRIFGVDSTGPIISFLPILLIGVLFGLAMDYQVFLVTRMREEYVHGADADAAVVSGFQPAVRVVTAAAIIMTACSPGSSWRRTRSSLDRLRAGGRRRWWTRSWSG